MIILNEPEIFVLIALAGAVSGFVAWTSHQLVKLERKINALELIIREHFAYQEGMEAGHEKRKGAIEAPSLLP